MNQLIPLFHFLRTTRDPGTIRSKDTFCHSYEFSVSLFLPFPKPMSVGTVEGALQDKVTVNFSALSKICVCPES